MMRFIDFFSGIGGFALGLQRAGHQLLGACEINKDARRVYETRLGHRVEWEDVQRVDPRSLPPADLWTAGFPCQDLSPAGPRTGFDGERSRLVFDLLDLAASAAGPRWLLLENSRGLLHVRGGRDFGRLLAELDQRGFVGAWRVLDALRFGVPQRRRRVYILARRAGAAGPRPEEVLQVGARCRGHPAPCGGERPEVAHTLTTRAGSDRQNGTTYVSSESSTPSASPCASSSCKSVDVAAPLRAARPRGAVCAYTMSGAGSNGPVRESDHAATLTTNGGWGAAAGGTILAFGRAQITHPENRAKVAPDGPAPTLSRTDRACVAYGPPEGQEGAWMRILMPVECERLQGYPDGWTDVGLSDHARYRLLGNSVAIPVIEWIGHRLAEVGA